MDVEIVRTLSILNTEMEIDVAETVDDPLYWLVPHVGLEKRICSSFDD